MQISHATLDVSPLPCAHLYVRISMQDYLHYNSDLHHLG